VFLTESHSSVTMAGSMPVTVTTRQGAWRNGRASRPYSAMTPSEFPRHRSGDLQPEADGADGRSPLSERPLWAKASLLDASPESTDADPPQSDVARRDAVAGGSVPRPAERHALLLDQPDAWPEEPSPGTEATDPSTRDLPGEADDDGPHSEIHKQKSVENVRNERPVADRIAHVVEVDIDGDDPEIWIYPSHRYGKFDSIADTSQIADEQNSRKLHTRSGELTNAEVVARAAALNGIWTPSGNTNACVELILKAPR
jgi:hypothetical protein